MIRALTSILLFTLLSSTLHAGPAGQRNGQGQGMRGAGQGQRMAHVQEALGLSQEQITQIREIRQNGGGRDEIRAVLTGEQRTMLDDQRANRMGQGPRGGKGAGDRSRDGKGQNAAPADTGNDQG